MSNNDKHKLPITGSDIFTLLFLSLFVVIGVVGFVLVTRTSGISPFIVIWSGIFIGVPCYMGASMFKRLFSLRRAIRDGEYHQAKIVRHQVDDSIRVNGRPVRDLVVRYFDGDRVVEKLVDANIAGGNSYPVGSTVDIYEYDKQLVLGSKGYEETLRGEEQLMAQQGSMVMMPVDANGTMTTHVITCPCCGEQVAIDDKWRPSKVTAE